MNDKPIGARQQAVLERLAILNPEGVAGARKALGALRDDQNILPLVEAFNLARDAARQIQTESAAGAWAVSLLEQYLNQIGVPAAPAGLCRRLWAWLARQLEPYIRDLIDEAVAQFRAELRAEIARERVVVSLKELQSGDTDSIAENGRRPVRRFIGQK
jgi:hypothetical protein